MSVILYVVGKRYVAFQILVILMIYSLEAYHYVGCHTIRNLKLWQLHHLSLYRQTRFPKSRLHYHLTN